MADKATNQPNQSDKDKLTTIIDALKNAIKDLDDSARQDKGLPCITANTTWNQLLQTTQLKPAKLNGRTINNYAKPNFSGSVSKTLKEQLCEQLDIQWDRFDKQDIQNKITTYINNLPVKRPGHHHNGGGRNDGCQNVLLGRIIEAIIDADFMGTDSWSKIIKQLAPDYSNINAQTISSWKIDYEKNLCKGIKKHKMLNQIAETLGFDPKYWGDVYGLSETDISKFVNEYKQKFVGRIPIDISQFTTYFSSNTDNAKNFLNDLKQAISNQKLEKIFTQPETLKFLQDLSDCQVFRQIFLMLYDAGAYRLIQDYILPQAAGCLEGNETRYFLAHYYGSAQIQQYQKAAQLLNNFTFNNIADEADIKTSMLSNILRNAFLTTSIRQWSSEAMENLFNKMCDAYAEVFQQHPHYYPGINYAYMLYLGQKLFPDNKAFQGDEIESIFVESKTSIDNEKNTQNPYYAVISELEFQALLNELPTNHKTLINKAKPTRDMMLRTLRQLNFVLDIRLRDETTTPDDAQGLQTLRKTLQGILGIADRPFAA